MKAQIIYYYRGLIERGRRYQWRQGYSANSSEGRMLYPWMTKHECQADAKKTGASAVFRSQARVSRVSAKEHGA